MIGGSGQATSATSSRPFGSRWISGRSGRNSTRRSSIRTSQGGRPPFDPVMMFQILAIQAANNLSDARPEFLINDRLSFLRFLGLSLADRRPRRPHDLAIPREAHESWSHQNPFRAFRRDVEGSGLNRHVGPDRCAPHRRAAPAQYERREESHQGGPHSRCVEGEARKATRTATPGGLGSSPRPSRTGTAHRQRSIGRSRSLAIQITSRSIAALASFANGARRTPPPMKAAVYGRTSRQNQYGERRMGGLPIGGQRGVHKKERLRQPCPSQKAEGARPARSGAPTTPNRKSAPRPSMCSRSKRAGWICSFAPSAARERP